MNKKIILSLISFNILNAAEANIPLLARQQQEEVKINSEIEEKEIPVIITLITSSNLSYGCLCFCNNFDYKRGKGTFNIKLPKRIKSWQLKTKLMESIQIQTVYNNFFGYLEFYLNETHLNFKQKDIDLTDVSYIVVNQIPH